MLRSTSIQQTKYLVTMSILMLILLFATACGNLTPSVSTAEENIEATDAATAVAIEESASEATDTEAISETVTETATETVTETITETTANTATTFTIVPEGTEARYSIYELLMGQDKTVIGATNAVMGSMTVDPANPAATTLSPITIDASTFATDSSRRDGAVRRWVLESNQEAYQYITFTPTAIDGLPESVTIGEPFEFRVTGDLTIRDITKQETFAMKVTANSETELVGLGQTTVMRGDYNLSIPSVPSVANVAEEVPLEIEFRAVAE